MKIPIRLNGRLVRLEESALLRAFVDLSERPKAPCRRCGKTVILTPAQIRPEEKVGEIGVVCAGCSDKEPA